MQTQRVMPMLFLLLASSAPAALGAKENPLGKVIQLIDDLAAKVTKEGEMEQKAYDEYTEWCDDVSKNTAFAIKTAESDKQKLEAKIGELASTIEVCTSEIEKLAAATSSGEAELKNATTIREKEAADFAASEKELMEAIDALDRAIKILDAEMSKNPASFAQVDTSSMQAALQGIAVVLDAASFSTSDRKKLLALAQTQESSDDMDMGAPAPAAYKTHSTGILDVLEDMKEKAEGELSDLRKAEVKAKHNYELLKQSLEDQLAADTKDMKEQKSDKAAAEEGKATAEGDLEMTVKELAHSKEELATAQGTCISTAADHQTTVAARAEELKVIAEAKKILEDTSAGAVEQTYSFVQIKIESRADLARQEVVTMVKQLAKEHHSAALAQLSSRIAAVAKYGASNGEDVFGKIKGLISDMIAKLEQEAEDEAAEKSYCDEQMAKTEMKKSELEDDIAKMTAKIDQAAAKSAQLKEEVKVLENELAALAKEQAEMDKIRQETHADYKTAKADLTLGLTGVRKALSVLRDYYGGASFVQQPEPPVKHSKSTGAGQSIIGILEVCESDFADNLAKEEQEEADAASEYEKMTQENKVTKATKDQDVKYKTQESKSLDKTISEISGDREGANTELSAVLEYYSKIKDRCIAKPETYEERVKRRTAEINGLKSALETLENETAFVQRKRRHMRGAIVAH